MHHSVTFNLLYLRHVSLMTKIYRFYSFINFSLLINVVILLLNCLVVILYLNIYFLYLNIIWTFI